MEVSAAGGPRPPAPGPQGRRCCAPPILRRVLERIFLEIELSTLRGRALFAGIIAVLEKGVLRARDILGSLGRVLVIGLSLLNSPPIYGVRG